MEGLAHAGGSRSGAARGWRADRLMAAPTTLPANKIIFVVGNSRSGTTMTARLLGLHPDIHALRELHFFEEMWDPRDGDQGLPHATAVALAARLLHNARSSYTVAPEGDAYRSDAEAIVEGIGAPVQPHRVLEAVMLCETRQHGAVIPCEQTPRNVYYIAEILRLFPAARVLNVVRDPRDVLLSQKNWWRRRLRGSQTPWPVVARQWIDYHPLTTSLLWRGGVRAADRVATSERVHTVRFEDLVADPA